MELLKLTEVEVTSGYDATISYISNDTVDPAPSPLGAYMYIREASDNTVHRWSEGDNTLTKIRIGTPQSSTPDQQDLIMPSDSHLSVSISKDAMLDGTYLEERFSEDSYEALYIAMIVQAFITPSMGRTHRGNHPEGDIFPLGFSSSISDQPFQRDGQPWGGCQNLVDVGATYSDVFDCVTPRSVSSTMPFVALDQHILMSPLHAVRQI